MGFSNFATNENRSNQGNRMTIFLCPFTMFSSRQHSLLPFCWSIFDLESVGCAFCSFFDPILFILVRCPLLFAMSFLFPCWKRSGTFSLSYPSHFFARVPLNFGTIFPVTFLIFHLFDSIGHWTGGGSTVFGFLAAIISFPFGILNWQLSKCIRAARAKNTAKKEIISKVCGLCRS